ncbi:MAG: hypothetical protein O3C68_03420 [Proteobacteria bacterium]|nr:hypothetical protein [Pseudomonadota bacterium]
MPIDPLPDQKGFALEAALQVSSVEVALPDVADDYSQLLVFGHVGSDFWNLLDEPLTGDHPLDAVSIKMVEGFLQATGCTEYLVLYPLSDVQIDLRGLGKQLGWHADSALGIGINAIYGTWFAYRVVVLANTSYETSEARGANNLAESPCASCITRPCVGACPVDAPGDTFDLQACITERSTVGSACAYQCLARNACPVGTEYRYDQDQMRYHYEKSLQVIQSTDLT